MDKFLKKLAERLRVPDSEILTADEVADWPAGMLARLVKGGVIQQVDNATGVICNECEKGCFIEPDRRENPSTGEEVGVFFCCEDGGMGRIEIGLDRLKQWRIDKKRLWKRVYGFDSEWQIPWDENDPEYLPLQEAVNLAGDDAITVRKMSRLLEDPGFPVHHMHASRRCRVHLEDFRRWLKYARHGVITDEAIDEYLRGVKERKERTQRKRWASRRS